MTHNPWEGHFNQELLKSCDQNLEGEIKAVSKIGEGCHTQSEAREQVTNAPLLA